MATERQPASEPPRIPQPVQETLRDLAKSARYLADDVENGASWTRIYTWLLSMEPRLTTLLDIGLDGIPRSARLDIDGERQEQIMADFDIPDTPPEEEA